MTGKIRDVMTKNPVILDADRPVTEAAQAMSKNDVGNVLVTRDRRLEGILTDRDLVVRCLANGSDPRETKVGQICSKELATLSPDDDSDHAVKLMGKKAIRRIPVVENDRPTGMVSLGDLALARDRDSALGGISAARPNR